jgi:hypothetical protein
VLYKTGKYTIKNYVNSASNTFEVFSNKQGKFSTFLNFAACVTQASKYLLPSKIEGRCVVIDRKRQLLFALL